MPTGIGFGSTVSAVFHLLDGEDKFSVEFSRSFLAATRPESEKAAIHVHLDQRFVTDAMKFNRPYLSDMAVKFEPSQHRQFK